MVWKLDMPAQLAGHGGLRLAAIRHSRRTPRETRSLRGDDGWSARPDLGHEPMPTSRRTGGGFVPGQRRRVRDERRGKQEVDLRGDDGRSARPDLGHEPMAPRLPGGARGARGASLPIGARRVRDERRRQQEVDLRGDDGWSARPDLGHEPVEPRLSRGGSRATGASIPAQCRRVRDERGCQTRSRSTR